MSLISLINKRRLVIKVVSMLISQATMDHPIALGQLSSTNLILMNFIHLLMVVEEAVLEEEACFDTLKKFQDHKLGMESHYMMIVNIHVPPCQQHRIPKEKKWDDATLISQSKTSCNNKTIFFQLQAMAKKGEAPRGTFQPSTKPKIEER
ncbi:hypothetical protein M9H77_06872 [Catharanthus roseus]|uniref:Uncharacterized protein n=1 Tax=Catharanthus roseus TaxID=4058 RepID=A0ACC0BTB4_CATRO|nr:hypothetical protein M9H77_06872 [Catharanthus roseus]